jgi:hypothetical protein
VQLGSILSSASDIETVREQAGKIVASGVLGRSRFYAALLEYLVVCAERNHAPKEIEIAAEVFDRGDGFDPSQDSMVRVYAHNLRQKLDQFYLDRGSDEPQRITIPKGEYRIALGERPDEPAPMPVARAQPRSRYGPALVVAASLIVGLVLGRMSGPGEAVGIESPYDDVAGSALWRELTDDTTPVTIVVGDYYIFGERDRYGNIDRMVREFGINSSRDLDEWFMLEPDNANRYVDLDMSYLPTGTASALLAIGQVLAAAGKEVEVVWMSQLDTAAIRENHIVYVGYLSGLGMLSDFAFAGSALTVGETYDELVNRETGTAYVSEAGMPESQRSYRDYGLFATLPGPGGHRLVFVAGMRDEGLMQTAEAVSDDALIGASIAAVATEGAVPPAFQLVYEVAGLDRTNLSATIVYSAPLIDERIAVGRLGL